MDWIKKDWKFIYIMHLKVYIGLLHVCELRFIRQCFWYFRLISWYHEEGQKTTNRTKNLWRFLRAATPCLRTCISAQVILSRKFHKVESNKLLSDFDFLPKTLFGYLFYFWKDVIQHVWGLESELEQVYSYVSFGFLKIERIYVTVIYI